MSERASAAATFEVTKWDEQLISEIEGGPTISRAVVTKSFHGDLEGEGVLEYLILHRGEGSASFIGLERVTGRLGDRTGSFVLEHAGTFEGGIAQAACEVVPESATGDLAGLRGEAHFVAEGRQAPITLAYEFE